MLVSGPGVQRWLNITPANVIGFFPKALEAEADTDGGAERRQGGVASTETTTSLLVVPPGRAREVGGERGRAWCVSSLGIERSLAGSTCHNPFVAWRCRAWWTKMA